MAEGRAHAPDRRAAPAPPAADARELLDLGAGIGLNLEVLRAFGVVDALESNRIGLEALAGNPHVRDVFAHALPQPLARRYDVIGAFDVIEHLPDDDDAVAWIDAHLKPGGLLVATVPAYAWMFSAHDVALGHFRRYTETRLRRVVGERLRVRQSGYFVTGLFPLAALSRLPSVLRHRIGAARQASEKQSAKVPGVTAGLFAGLLAAEAWLVGQGVDLPFGLSVYCVAQGGGRA